MHDQVRPPRKCTCGSNHVGGGGHSSWCDTQVEDTEKLLPITDEDIDRLFEALKKDIDSGRICDHSQFTDTNYTIDDLQKEIDRHSAK